MKKVMTLFMLLLFLASTFSSACRAEQLTAADRVKNLAQEEVNWRYLSGGGKVLLGGVLLGSGIATYSAAQQNFFTAIALIPLSLILAVPGAITLGWGAFDLLFGSREYENQYDKLKLASDPAREDQAVEYLKAKAEKDEKDRQPSFWNAFGLFSMFKSPAEREYQNYLKDRQLTIK
jgi:hypothetical protein